MEDNMIKTGTLLTIDNTNWRVIFISQEFLRIVNADIAKLEVKTILTETAQDMYMKGELTIAKDQRIYILDFNRLSDDEMRILQLKRKMVEEIDDMYGPSFVEITKSKAFTEVINKYKDQIGLSRATAYRTINKWFQSGMQISYLTKYPFMKRSNETALSVNGYKNQHKTVPGRPSKRHPAKMLDSKDIDIFEGALKIYKSSRTMTYQEIYADMLMCNYMGTEEYPTINQLKNYISKRMTTEEREKRVTSAREYRNEKRLLRDTPRREAILPCQIVEIDAWESDIDIISEFMENQNIGKPIVYFIRDVCTHALVAGAVGFENNSQIGASNVLINLFAPTVTTEDGIVGLPGIIPRIIRCDRGSEYTSKYMQRVCNELQIDLQLVEAAMGSMKGGVEHSFSELHDSFKTYFKGLGLIEKRYDSTHRKDASITLSTYTEYIGKFIARYNLHSINSLRLPAEMIREGYKKTPRDIWAYKIKHNNIPRLVSASVQKQALYALMYDGEASISREGITFRKLSYWPTNDSDLLRRMTETRKNANRKDNNGKPLNSISIRFDPRSINYLYYQMDNGEIGILELLSSKCGDLRDITWAKYEDYMTVENLIDIDGEHRNLHLLMDRISDQKKIAEDVNAKPRFIPSNKNMKEHRYEDNQINLFDKAIEHRMNIEEADNKIEPPTIEIEPAESTPPSEAVEKPAAEQKQEDKPDRTNDTKQDMESLWEQIAKMNNRRRD